MKKSRLFSAVMAVAFMFMIVVPVFAAEARASDQIHSYIMDVTTDKDIIDVHVSVTGCDVMNKIGCESIKVYEASGSRWVLVESLDEDDEGMSNINRFAYKNNIYCTGEAGVEYKVVVTIFAEDSEARDTRTRTFYVTGE